MFSGYMFRDYVYLFRITDDIFVMAEFQIQPNPLYRIKISFTP